MKVAYVLYPDFTALDLVGPYEIISRWPDAQVHFVASTMDPVRTDRGLTVLPTHTPDTVPQPDLIVVPGSQNPVPVLSDEVLVDWLRVAEVWVGNADSGFVRPDQKARVKLLAYPFQKHGMLEGVVRHIGADAQEKPESGGAQGRGLPEAAYRTLIGLSEAGLVPSQARKLLPGDLPVLRRTRRGVAPAPRQQPG